MIMKRISQVIILFVVVSFIPIIGLSQDFPPDLRNFLIKFGSSVSLGAYDDDLMYTKVSNKIMDNFVNSFISKESIVYNDVYHKGSFPQYVTVEDYCELIAGYYPEGFHAFLYSPVLEKVYKRNNSVIYEITVNKYLAIDFAMDNPPKAYFDSFVKLKLSVAQIGSEYKILMIEKAQSSLLSDLWLVKVIPQGVNAYAGFGNSKLVIKDIPSGFNGFTEKQGSANSFGLGFSWDISGRDHMKFGIVAGIEYFKTQGGLNLEKYNYSFNDVDQDNYPYTREVSAKNVTQDYEISGISIPFGFHFNYSLNTKWKTILLNENKANARFPYKRNFHFKLIAGLKFNYLTVSSVTDNNGSYSYQGNYQVFNPLTGDSSVLIVRDIGEYGFYSDTTFKSGNLSGSFKSSYFSSFIDFNIYYPINQYLEVYAGPTFQFSITSLNDVNETFCLTKKAGDLSNLASASELGLTTIGFNAGVLVNLKPPKTGYYKYPSVKNNKAFDVKREPVKFHGKMNRTKVLLNPHANFKTTLTARLEGEWLNKDKTFKLNSRKSKNITIDFPSDQSLCKTGEFIIEKPFGMEVELKGCAYYNNVNNPMIRLPLDTLIGPQGKSLCLDLNRLDFNVEKLPVFNFVYVTLDGRDNQEAREDLVDQIRKIYRSARFDQEEILIYISTELNKPVIYYNFEIVPGARFDFKAFPEEEFEEFLKGLLTRYNSAIKDYEDDIHNIETIIGDNFKIAERLNASRRYVKFWFLPLDAQYYRTKGYINETDNTIVQNNILYITNKYCLGISPENDQYQVNVLLRANQYRDIHEELRTPINECNNVITIY